jgi:hypothetical protein
MAEKYITISELRNAPYSISEDKADNKHLTTLLGLTKELIDNLCNQAFEPDGTDLAPVEEKVSGTGKDTVFLPRKLLTLKEVRIYSSTLNYYSYTPENFTVKEKYITWNIYSDEFDNNRILVEDFPRGSFNIGVFGIWGYATAPEGVKYLQGKMITKIIDDDAFAERFNSQSIGDYSATVALRGDKEFAITGDKELDVLIKRYRNNPFGLRVI